MYNQKYTVDSDQTNMIQDFDDQDYMNKDSINDPPHDLYKSNYMSIKKYNSRLSSSID